MNTWNEITNDAEKSLFILNFNGSLINSPLHFLTTQIWTTALPFYKDTKFYRATSHKNIHPFYGLVHRQGKNILLLKFDDKNDPIYGANELEKQLMLTEDNIKEYIKFFFSFVKGRHGRFYVIETIDEVPFKEEDGNDDKNRDIKERDIKEEELNKDTDLGGVAWDYITKERKKSYKDINKLVRMESLTQEDQKERYSYKVTLTSGDEYYFSHDWSFQYEGNPKYQNNEQLSRIFQGHIGINKYNEEKKRFERSVLMIFKNALFSATAEVNEYTGIVNLSSEKLLMDEIPIDEAALEKTRLNFLPSFEDSGESEKK